MPKIVLDQLPQSPLPAETGTVLRRFASGENITVAKITFLAGSVLPGHRHVNEQFTIVLEGTLEFVNESGTKTIIGAGEMMHLPGGEWHGATALSDATVMDVFSPVRADWSLSPSPPA